MLNLMNEEVYKLIHKKSTLLTPIILFFLMLLVGLLSIKSSDPRFYISAGFAGFQWGGIILIVICANIISMEFEHGTIKNLIGRYNSRGLIYLSKFIIIVVYDLVLHILTLI
ncbi:hypothetical protein EQ500_04295 [Lactobacillus sp. XV13L]|nr:hypothetical protein [Lactobacillus sp. XV13L]